MIESSSVPKVVLPTPGRGKELLAVEESQRRIKLGRWIPDTSRGITPGSTQWLPRQGVAVSVS
jgi:hypothetical protein